MKIANVSFSEKGKDWFTSLKRSEQKEFLIERGNSRKKVTKLLKGIKYGKLSRSAEQVEQDKQSELPSEES